MKIFTKQTFTAEVSEYVVLTLRLADYKGTQRQLPAGYDLLSEGSDISQYRAEEKALLQYYFVAWKKPYYGKLPGFSQDSPVFVTCQSRLVAGVYLCTRNELGWAGWGQMHYAFIHPKHAGKGIYSVMFREAAERAQRMNLEGLVLNSDRYMLPEVYERWGAVPFRKVKKGMLRAIAGRLWNRIQANQR